MKWKGSKLNPWGKLDGKKSLKTNWLIWKHSLSFKIVSFKKTDALSITLNILTFFFISILIFNIGLVMVHELVQIHGGVWEDIFLKSFWLTSSILQVYFWNISITYISIIINFFGGLLKVPLFVYLIFSVMTFRVYHWRPGQDWSQLLSVESCCWSGVQWSGTFSLQIPQNPNGLKRQINYYKIKA